MESACTLRFGFNDLIKSISYTKQSNLFLHFLSTFFCFSLVINGLRRENVFLKYLRVFYRSKTCLF